MTNDRTCPCGTPVDDQRVICTRCTTQLSHHLGDQESHRQELVTALTRQVRMNAPNDGGRGSDLTLAWKRMGDRFLDTISLDEVRAILATLPPARAAAEALHAQRNLLVSWCRLVMDLKGNPRLGPLCARGLVCDHDSCTAIVDGMPPVNTIRAMSAYLVWNMRRLHTHEAAVELVAEVRDLVKQIVKVIDTPATRTRVKVGPCPEEDPERGGPCQGEVVAIIPADEAVAPMMRCAACTTEYSAEQWRHAGRRILSRQGRSTAHLDESPQMGAVA